MNEKYALSQQIHTSFGERYNVQYEMCDYIE